MECPPKPKRCTKNTTCNKKTNICTPKTVKCARGTKLGNVTKMCDLVPNALTKRCPAGSRRNKKTGDCENEFINLCKKHIMVSTLDAVIKTSYLSNKACTLFFIGEKHQPHSKCMEILDMFKALVGENETLPKPIQIDIMIEYLQKDFASSVRYKDNLKYFKQYHGQQLHAYDKTAVQMNNIRQHFQDCMDTRNCSVRVHWTDPSNTFDSKDSRKNIHEWLRELEGVELFKDTWTTNPKITIFFNKESDMSKLLTENRFVVKEIQKASKINSTFTLDFCTKLFMKMYSDMKKELGYNWEKVVTYQNRRVMDFYTAARIIKSKMKHVIFYAGNLHTTNVTLILTSLNFKLVHSLDGQCL
jgi:hypothetical protein